MPRWTILGLAIVSQDDCIADAQGNMPEVLRNDADWALFQSELDQASLTVLGRLGHEAHGNAKQRRRMIVSSRSSGLEERADGLWWNPDLLDWPTALARAVPEGGLIAVPGGQAVFDLFLGIGFDRFHLTRAHGVEVPGGRPLFSARFPYADCRANPCDAWVATGRNRDDRSDGSGHPHAVEQGQIGRLRLQLSMAFSAFSRVLSSK